jgi:radical SAM superfamily enzyme YgiQ (UPF0313 family)
LGIESGDDFVFDSIDKGEKLTSVKAGVRSLQAAGIQVGGFFIIGLPGSTRDADLRSLALAQELGIEAWWFNFVPYRFTRAEEWVREHGNVLRPSEDAPLYGRARIEPVFETSDYTRAQRIATYEEVNVRMGYFDRLIDTNMGRWAQIAYLAATASKYGAGPTLACARFLGSGLGRMLWSARQPREKQSARETVTEPKAASQNLAPNPTRPIEGK